MNYRLSIAELQLSFHTDADPSRVERARAYVEEEYEGLRSKNSLMTRDKLFGILLIAIADNLLDLQEQRKADTERLEKILRLMQSNLSTGESDL